MIPGPDWLRAYRSAWLEQDVIAGLTLAAYAVPVGVAYASLAGLPPQAGLYCFIGGGAVYALSGSSRHLSIGPTAAISVMVASVVGGLAGGDSGRYATIAALSAAMVSVIFFFAWALRLSTFVSFISETILLGFKAGAALAIASTQLPKLFGVPGGGDNFFQRIYILTSQLGETRPVVLCIGALSLALLAAGERFWPTRPLPLLLIVISIACVTLSGIGGATVPVVGPVRQGLPAFSLADVGMRNIDEVAVLAFACFLLSYIESISAARVLALKHDYRVDPRRELLGLGMANLAAALGSGYPVAGGLSQSAVNEEAGARSPLSLLVAAAALTVVLFFLTGLLVNLPEAVLAAIVIVALSGLVSISDFRRLQRVSVTEFQIAIVAFAAVLFLGILKGVMFAVMASVLFLLRLMAAPHVAPLGRIPGTKRFTDITRHPDNEQIPGLFIFRVEAPLLYFNVDNVDRTVLQYVRAAPSPVREVICDLSTSPYIDSAGAQMLARLQEQLAAVNIDFRVAETHSEVRDILRVTGVDKRFGGVSRHTSLSDIVDDFNRRTF